MMMYKGRHWHPLRMLVKVLMLLSVLLFFWSAFMGDMVWGFDETFYFESVVVLGLMLCGMRGCRHCMKGMMMGKMGEMGGMGEMNSMGKVCEDGKCGECENCRK